jgi:hypothetical protein
VNIRFARHRVRTSTRRRRRATRPSRPCPDPDPSDRRWMDGWIRGATAFGTRVMDTRRRARVRDRTSE